MRCNYRPQYCQHLLPTKNFIINSFPFIISREAMNSDELSSERRDLPPSDYQRDAPPVAEMDHGMNHHESINIKPRSQPYHHSHGGGQYSYPPHHYQYPGSRHPIQSVVTTSFSTDDQDREDRSAFRPPFRNSYDYPPPPPPREGRYYERTASTDAGAPYHHLCPCP